MNQVKKKPELLYLHMDVTVKCNLHCKHCFYGDYNTPEKIDLEVSYERLTQVIDEAISMGCQKIIFSGGEVYTSDKFERLLDYCYKKKLKTIFITNGTLIDDKSLKYLISIKDNIDEIKVSYDGKKQDLIRGKGTQEKTLSTLYKLNENGFPWTINTILTKHNIEEVFDIYEWLKTTNAKNWRIDLPFNLGNYIENGQELGIKNLEYAFELLAKLLKKYLTDKPSFDLWMFDIYRPGLEDSDFGIQNETMHTCVYNKRNLAIRGNGEVTPCSRFLNLRLGNIKNNSIREVKQSKEFKDFWNIKIQDIEECMDCKYLYICGAGCRANAISENGNILSHDPMACIRMDLFEKHILPVFTKETQDSFYRLIEMRKQYSE